MMDPVPEVPGRSGNAPGTVQPGIGKPPPTEAEQDHQNQGNQKCGIVLTMIWNGSKSLKATAFLVTTAEPPQRPITVLSSTAGRVICKV